MASIFVQVNFAVNMTKTEKTYKIKSKLEAVHQKINKNVSLKKDVILSANCILYDISLMVL